jgi:hypothetical protein
MPTPKLMRLALGLGAVCAASAGVLFSGAFFSSTDTSKANRVSAAQVALHVYDGAHNLATGNVLIPAADLRPGEKDPREAIVELENGGDVAGKLALTTADAPAGPGLQLLQILHLDVDDCGASATCASPATVYSGAASGANDLALAGTLAASDSRFVRLRLNWPGAADDPSLYGVATDFSFHWTATTAGT